MRSLLKWVSALAALASSVLAQDAQTYLYDANGRLIAATTARPTSGSYASYALDDADNRTARNAYATTGPTVAGKLLSGESLIPTQAITNGSYTLTLQTSGDLVVTGPSGLVQHSCTGTGRSLYARMETNGNLVVRDVAGTALWQSNTGAYSGAELFLNSDGTLAVKSGGVTRWSGTVTGGGCF
jgi:YD repeat-containing protein